MPAMAPAPPMTLADAHQRALDQLSAYGLEVDTLDCTGKVQRCRHRDDKPRRKDGWYVAVEHPTSTGAYLVVGAYGWWKDPNSPYRLRAALAGLPEHDRQALDRARKAADKRAKLARDALAQEAAVRANRLWVKLKDEGTSQYLWRKKVSAYGVRFARGSVVVPMRTTPGGELVSVQWIGGDGTKRFLTGTAKQGAFHLIGEPEKSKVLFVAEGYATAASVHMATGQPCAVAFDAGNLRPAATNLRKAYPRHRLVFAGDDDHATTGNPGRSKAMEAADALGGVAVFPRFAGTPGTDWNDLHVAEGKDVVRDQLRDALRRDRDREQPPPAPPGGSGPSDFAFDLAVLLRDYVLIYGTETVFDSRVGRILTLGGLRAAAGSSLVKIWQEHPARRLVQADGVVFDPSCKVDPTRTVNLFRGWPMRPEPGRCERLIELLGYLCGEDHAIFEWVLRWAAYPLQHPGAKMRSAVIMHGPEGTGKNTFWGAVRDIYGEYAAQIGQMELESQFNGWASRKLFVIGNEVVSRQELYHHRGRLKSLITEPEWMINEKMLPVRMESNCANFVFFSNVVQPATPDPDDRRYMVVWTPPALDETFYREVGAELRQGGVAALYAYLLELDLGDFNEHTKPLMTMAKQELIEASEESWSRFQKQWAAGELEWPYIPCRTQDAYRAYRRWCDQRGERSPAREAVFSPALAKRLPRKVAWILEGTRKVSARLFVPNEWQPGPDMNQQAALGAAVEAFNRVLNDSM